MYENRSKLIRGKSDRVKEAAFESFSEKPINYHKDVLADFNFQSAKPDPEPRPSERDVREAVARETEKLRREFEAKLKEKLRTAASDAKDSASAELVRGIDLLKNYANMIQSEKEELATRYEQEVLDLAFEIAGRILGHELKERPDTIAQMTREALKQVIDCKRITVRANPDDLSYLQNLRSDIADQLSQETRFELISDNKVQPGGCVIDTERGSLDARVGSQLETLKNNLQSSD